MKKKETLDKTHPSIAKEFDIHANEGLKPNDFFSGSNKKVWWVCKKQHKWEAIIANRVRRNQKCPYCENKRVGYGNDLKNNFPELVNQWNYDKNELPPENFLPFSNKKVWWKCELGHEWESIIANRTRLNRGCPYCTNQKIGYGNDLKNQFPTLLNEWDYQKNVVLPENVVSGSTQKVWWICKYEHSWKASVVSRTGDTKSGCPKCTHQTSELEIFLFSEISAIFKNVSLRKKIKGYEIDIFIDDINFGIEVDGWYWHRDRFDYDVLKSNDLKKNGITLFRIREKPLKIILDTDIIVDKRWARIDKMKVSKLLFEMMAKYLDKSSLEFRRMTEYGSNTKPVNSTEFEKLLSELPNPIQSKNLAFLYPDLVKEWDNIKNGNLKPENFSFGSEKKVWWRCKKDHSFPMVIGKRTQGRGCPYCSGFILTRENSLAGKFPQLMKEWDHSKNLDISPEKLRPTSTRKVWWKCELGHEWKSAIINRTRKDKKASGCHNCSRIRSNTSLSNTK